MKKSLLIIITILLLISASCKRGNEEPLSRTGFHLNTIINITIYGGNGNETLDLAFDEVDRLEALLSKHVEGSDIYKINEAAGQTSIELQPDTMVLLAESKRFFELSKGFFDITVGPLVDLWGIGTEEAAVPAPNDLEAALDLVNMDAFDFCCSSAELLKDGMSIDTGGIAKGYIADKVAQVLKDEGCSGAVINLGGNVLTIGKKPDGSKWRIGVQDPFKSTGTYMEVVEIDEMSVVTSGPYERNFEEDGVVYHHILNPYTGYPIENNIAGVTVISGKSIDGDGLSTSIFAMGAKAGLELVEKTENTECYFVLNDGTIIMSSGFGKYIP